MIAYNLDGSVTLISDDDPEITEEVPGPRNSPEQLARIIEFHTKPTP